MAFFSKIKRAVSPNIFTSQAAPTANQGRGPQRTHLGNTQPNPQAATTLPTSSMGVAVDPRPHSSRRRAAESTLAVEDERPRTAVVRSRETQTINVILFGEAGVGKSAVVNLIAQREVARVSSDVVGCTMRSTRYDISFDGMNFRIFDTVGLNQPELERNSHLDAIESAYKLILELQAAGGIHLLLFCIPGSRLKLTSRNSYRLFAEFLCQKKVPVAIVVTGLEREVKMEDWWTRNKSDIEEYGIKSDGHACITTVTDGTSSERLKYTESQRKIRELLKSCSFKTEVFLLDTMAWIAMTGAGMRNLTKKEGNPKKGDIEKVLSNRLRLSKDNVRRIIDMMEKSGTGSRNGGA